MSRRHKSPPPMATLMNTGAVLGQGMLILDVTQAAAKPGPVNPTTAGWFKRSEITESQVADFRRTCKPQIAACSPVRWLQSSDHQTWIAARRAISHPWLPNAFILPGLQSLSRARIKEAAHLLREQKLVTGPSVNQSDSQMPARSVQVTSHWIWAWKGVYRSKSGDALPHHSFRVPRLTGQS